MVGTPGGLSGDPDAAFSGRRAWGNDHGGGNYNGAYQADIRNRLSSVPIDVSGLDRVVVQYRRWLNVEDGVYDVASVYANDEVVWSNHATNQRQGDEHTQDTDWVLHTLVVDGPGDSLTLGWEIDSDGGLEFGGWNVDDVCVYAVEGPDLARVADFAASDDEIERVTLSWTQPDAPGATTAVVVRRDDRYGEARDDGEIVFVANDLTPGETIVAIDTFVGEGYYAVYTGDGTTFTRSAVEGENADRGTGLTEGDADVTGDELLVKQEGCGCATSGRAPGPGAFGWLAAALAGLVVTRRRR
jgi:MYXO-CTERM domain-containing protein